MYDWEVCLNKMHPHPAEHDIVDMVTTQVKTYRGLAQLLTLYGVDIDQEPDVKRCMSLKYMIKRHDDTMLIQNMCRH